MPIAEIHTTVLAHNAVEIADRINAGFEAGDIETVNGYVLVSRFRSPVARSWQNGSISITVVGRTKGKTNTIYIKVGQVLTAR